MNKSVLVVTLVALLSGCSDGIFTTPTTGELVDPDYFYEIDTWGSNSEIYEFTPKSNKSKSCVMFMLDSGRAMGLQCFNKEK